MMMHWSLKAATTTTTMASLTAKSGTYFRSTGGEFVPSWTAASEVSYMRQGSGKKKGGVRAMIGAAVRGARIEVSKAGTSSERLKIAAVLGIIIVKEIIGMILLIPYGLHALGIHRALATPARTAEEGGEGEGEGEGGGEGEGNKTSEKRERSAVGGQRREKEKDALLNFDRQMGQQKLELLKRGDVSEHVSSITIRRRASFPQSLQEQNEGLELQGGNGATRMSPTPSDMRRRRSGELQGSVRGRGGRQPSAAGHVGTRLLTWLAPKERSVSLVRDVRYGVRERNLLDIYIPNELASGNLLPTVVFVHGGVWASGEKWQYSPIGVRMAKEGTVAVLVQYTLFPEVLADDMIKDVSLALTWVMDNIRLYNGNPERIFLMGHSSGAHVSAMVLWQRAIHQLKHGSRSLEQEDGGGNNIERTIGDVQGSDATEDSELGICERMPVGGKVNEETCENQGAKDQNGHGKVAGVYSSQTGEQGVVDARQPYCFLGLSGVYDIGRHYAFEQRKGVAGISCMRPAIGGVDKFDAFSPSLLFASMGSLQSSNGNGCTHRTEPAKDHVKSTLHSLRGEKSAAHSKKNQMRLYSYMDDLPLACPAQKEKPALRGSPIISTPRRSTEKAVNTNRHSDYQTFDSSTPTSVVPPCLLLCSPGDKTVPVDSSLALEKAVLQIGCRAKAILYDDLGHTDFSIWGTKTHSKTVDELGQHVSDILDVVSERIPLDSICWD